MNHNTTRERIVVAADTLIYQQGYEYTSFADIAESVKISRGNFYHHFKSKDDILEAVIGHRLRATRMMLEQWEMSADTPVARIECFIRILIINRTKIKMSGCPVGTLSTELTKLDHALKKEATAIFSLFRHWLQKQFKLLGRANDADHLALHLLARSQGVATLANTFKDDKLIRREVQHMCDWLHSVANNPANQKRIKQK